MGKAKSTRRRGLGHPATCDIDYDAVELEALRLTEQYRQAHGLPFMQLRHYLQCLGEAGWLTPPGAPPRRRAVARPDVFTTGQVAKMCHVCIQTVHKWIRRGDLPGFHLNGGTHRRVTRENLVQFMVTRQLPLPDSLKSAAA